MSTARQKEPQLLRILLALTALGLTALLLTVAWLVGWDLLGRPGRPADRPGVERPEPVAPRPVLPRGDLVSEESATIAIFEAASPAVVFITTVAVHRDFFSLDVLRIPRGNGSGFIWDRRGHVVTNLHVVAEADAAQVTLVDGSSYAARVVGLSAEDDLAVLRIEAPAEELRPIPVGRSEDLQVGQSVFAIGNPFGLDQTLSRGVISGLGRELPSRGGSYLAGLIQTDAAINPGNSGGPLLDSSGRLIGVNAAIYSPTGAYAGIGFAIPVDTVNRVVPQLIAHGRVIRPRIGIRVADDSLARRLGMEGVLVLGVEDGSPAERAGIRGTRRARGGSIVLGDRIVGMEGKRVRNSGDLFRLLERQAPGDTVVLNLRRERAELDVKVTLAPGRGRT